MSDNPNSVICNICGIAYTLPEDEIVGNLPHVLLCSHIFCTACLRSLEFNNVILCPECKVESSLSEGGVDGLQVDSRIIGLIYTARMNKMKSHRSDKPRHRRHLVYSNPQCSPVKENIKQASDIEKVEREVEEALSQASENVAHLKNIQQTLVKGLAVQMRERARLQMEVDEAMDRAFTILHSRKGALLGELTNMERHFPSSQRVLCSVEERLNTLETAMQQARQVRQFPSLESYCNLDQVLETMQAPVDVQSFDLSCLSMGSGLSCVLYQEGLGQSLRACLKMVTGTPKILPEEGGANRRPPWNSRTPAGVGRRNGRPPPSHREPSALRQEQDGPWTSRPPRDSSPGPARDLDSSPDVIIEEIIEEEQDGEQGAKQAGRQGCQRRRKNPLHTSPRPVNQRQVLHEWVLVTYVVNPSHFYIRYVTERKASVLLSRKITSLCSGERCLFTYDDVLKTGCMVFVWWKEDLWRRAVVMEVFQRDEPDAVMCCPVSQLARIRVFFQDYGFSRGLTMHGQEESPDLFIRRLNKCLRKLNVAVQSEMSRWHPQAIKCSLKDIVPKDLVKGWSDEATKEFRRVVGSAAVEMHVFGEERDVLLVDLRKAPMDCSASNMPLSLREYLVFVDLARFYTPMVWNAKTVPCGQRPLQFYPPVYPCTDLELNAVVSHINSPAHFYIQLVDNMEYPLLMAKLQECYNEGGPARAGGSLEVYCPALEQACVARLDNKQWYRAQVIGVSRGRQVEVRYVDIGMEQTVPVSDLKKIKDEFFSLPAMAIKCCLADLLPLEEENTWSEACTQRFNTLANKRLVTAVATERVAKSKALPVRLFETSESSEQMTNIAELLVKEELACFRRGAKSRDSRVPGADLAVWDSPLEGQQSPPDPGSSAPASPGETLELEPCLLLPSNLKDMRVRVTHVASPGRFYVQLVQNDGQLKRVFETLKQEYARTEPQEFEWSVDMHCAANVNGVWERGQLCSAVTSGSVTEVVRCDFGNTVKLHVNNLRPLLPSLVGSMALECALSDIRPAGGRLTWTATACDFISHYLTGATGIMTIKENTELRPVPVSLFCSDRAGKSVSVADFLVSEGLALKERKPRECPMPRLEEEPEDSRAAAAPPLEQLTPSFSELQTSPLAQLLTPSPPPSKPLARSYLCLEKVKTLLYSPPELPHYGRSQRIISAIGEDGVIYARTQNAERQFEGLQERVQQHMKTLPRQTSYTWKSVLGCAVMGSDMLWYRGEVLEVMGSDMLWYRGEVLEVVGGHVKVRYVDTGLVENIPVCHVYPTVLCADEPQLCFPCQLVGVIPVGRTWQWDAVALLKELLLNRWVDMQVKELPKDPRGPLTVQIFLDSLTLSSIMVHHQHASVDQEAAATEEEHVKSRASDLDDWDINTEGVGLLEPVLGVFSYPRLPEKGEHFRVEIKHLRTPNEVFLYPLEVDVNLEEGEESLTEALKRVNDNIKALPELCHFPIEGPCLAEYGDGKFYRAKLLGFADLNPVKLLIRHVDFGSDDTLPTHKLRQIPAPLLRFPCQALMVRVAGVHPPLEDQEKERLSYRPEWSMKAALEMIDLLHGDITAAVTATEPELSVFLFDASGVLVQLPLVAKGLVDMD